MNSHLPLQDIYPSPSALVAHGIERTHRLELIQAVLEARDITHAIIRCQESLSQRHLLCKIFAATLGALGAEADAEAFDRLDSVNALAVNLEKLFRGKNEKVVLVLDEVEEQARAGGCLLPALARLGDLVRIHTGNVVRSILTGFTDIVYIYHLHYFLTAAASILESRHPSHPLSTIYALGDYQLSSTTSPAVTDVRTSVDRRRSTEGMAHVRAHCLRLLGCTNLDISYHA